MNWNEYRRLLVAQVEETRHNLDHAERQYKKAKAFHEVAGRALEEFDRVLEEKLNSLQEVRD